MMSTMRRAIALHTQEESYSGLTPMCTALWQRKRAQRCDSDGADSNVTVLTVTALGNQWLWHRCDSDVYVSVTAMATDTAVTAVTTDSAVSAVAADTSVTAMFTLVWQRWQLTVLWQRWKQSDSAVTAVAADSAVTAMCTLVWQHCQFCHYFHSDVHIAVTLMWTSLSH